MWFAKIIAYPDRCAEVFNTLHPGATGLCWSGMYIIKISPAGTD